MVLYHVPPFSQLSQPKAARHQHRWWGQVLMTYLVSLQSTDLGFETASLTLHEQGIFVTLGLCTNLGLLLCLLPLSWCRYCSPDNNTSAGHVVRP